MKPRFSVIVPTYMRPNALACALSSLAMQTYRDFEVVVVNDGGESIDKVLNQWNDRLDITEVVMETNGGLSRARNMGIAAAKGTWLAFLDDDDIFLPQHLETLASIDGADMVYTQCAILNQRMEPGSEIPSNSIIGGLPEYCG